MLWRLVYDYGKLLEGSCITYEQYKALDYRKRALYEPVTDESEMIELKAEKYCKENGIEKLLFYTQS